MGKYISDFIKDCEPFDYRDKCSAIGLYVTTMLTRTQSIFEYTGLPDTIPARMLETYLQQHGAVCITKYKDKLYAFYGGLGGEPDVYYQPTLYTISNPALNYSASLKIGEDCEIIRNDTFYMGLWGLFARYATALSETDITKDMLIKHLRAQFAFTCPDTRTKEAAEKYLEDMSDGKEGAMLDKSFEDLGIKVNPMLQTGFRGLQDIIETEQYIKASWFNEIGLNANFNMKRENLNKSETEMNFDALLPFVQQMLIERQEGVRRVNKLYGTNITVDFSGVWKKTETEMTAPEISGRPENETTGEGDADGGKTETE